MIWGIFSYTKLLIGGFATEQAAVDVACGYPLERAVFVHEQCHLHHREPADNCRKCELGRPADRSEPKRY